MCTHHFSRDRHPYAIPGPCYALDVPTSTSAATLPCACNAVKKLSRLLGRGYDTALAEAGINVTQWAVMRCIGRHPGVPLSHIAQELELDRTSLYRAVSVMVRDGWLEVTGVDDARSRTARITQRGKRVLAKAASGWEGMQNRVIGQFGVEAYQSLLAELDRLAACVGEDVS